MIQGCGVVILYDQVIDRGDGDGLWVEPVLGCERQRDRLRRSVDVNLFAAGDRDRDIGVWLSAQDDPVVDGGGAVLG